MKYIDRRTLLRGAGGLAVGLPLLEAMTSKPAMAATNVPTRLVIVYQTQGLFMDEWAPKLGSGTPALAEYAASDYTANIATGPFAEHLNDLVFVTGVNDQVAMDDPKNSNAHEAIFKEVLVGRYQTGESFDGAAAASVDYEVSQRIYETSPKFRALHLGPDRPWEPCFTARNTPVDRYGAGQTAQAFDDLFSDLAPTDAPAADKKRKRSQRVLDGVRETGAALRAKLGSVDQLRLDEYMSRIGELEASINTSGSGAGCALPQQIDGQRYDAAASNFIELGAMALACNLTRVVTFALGQTSQYPWLTDPAGKEPYLTASDWHEEVVHRSWHGPNETPAQDIAEAQARMKSAVLWNQQQVANLIGRLKSFSEGDGTLLDNTMLVYVNEFGATHEHRDKPYLIAGGCGGRIKTGRWLRYQNEPNNRLLLSILQAFVPESDPIHGTFSDRAYCAGGPLSGLVT